MKKYSLLGIGFIFLLIGCSKFLTVENHPTVTLEGVVLKVLSSDSLLVSQRDYFDAEDFKKTDAQLIDDPTYNLIIIEGSFENIEVGNIVNVMIQEPILQTYPQKAHAKDIQTNGMISFSEKTSAELIESVLKPELPYSEELLKIFPQTVNLQQRFNGYAEYGHIQTLKDVREKGMQFELGFVGKMMDGFGEGENRTFKLTYQIDHQTVTEKIENADPYSMLGQDDLLVSIIPNKIILKTPLEVGNSWLETFPYEGEDYTAKTTIVRAELNPDGMMEYETLTTVEGIDDYFQDIYKERRVFVTGSGMTAFSNLISLDAVGVEYSEEDQIEDLYMFGFGLSNEEVVK